MAASSATLHFSGGASMKHTIMEKFGLTVGDSTKMEARGEGFRENKAS